MPNSVLNNTHIASVSIFLQSSSTSLALSQTGYNSNLIFELDSILQCPSDTQMMIGLTSCEIPYSFYNIENQNNKLSLKIDGVQYNVQLDPQNYNVESLMKAVNLQLLAAQITMTFDDGKNKFIFTSSKPIVPTPLESSGTVFYPIEFISTTMHDELGISKFFSGNSVVLNCDNVCNLSGTGSVYVNLNNVSISNLDSRGSVNGVVSKINVTCNPGDYIFQTLTEIQYYIINDRVIDNFNISLTDDNGEQLNMNGCHWSLSLTVHWCKKRVAELDEQYILNRTLKDNDDEKEQPQKPKSKKKKKKSRVKNV